MNPKLAELHRQRGELQERIGAQRLTLATQLAPLREASSIVLRVQTLINEWVLYLRTHPLQVAAALVGFGLLKPQRTWRWLWRGVGLWRSWRTLRAWVPAAAVSRWF